MLVFFGGYMYDQLVKKNRRISTDVQSKWNLRSKLTILSSLNPDVLSA